jgi:hypothetical protein
VEVRSLPVLLPRRQAAFLAAGGVAAVAIVGLVDPNQPGHYPTCPSRLLLRVDCPFCGGLRGVHDLVHGHPMAALDHNLLLLAIVPFLAWLWVSWLRRAGGQDVAPPVLPRWLVVAAVSVAVAFTIVRNLTLPGLAWLDAA